MTPDQQVQANWAEEAVREAALRESGLASGPVGQEHLTTEQQVLQRIEAARQRYLSCGFILEEGFPVADLERIAASMAAAARAAGVTIVTGDTKVVQKGKADGCYINTAGVGLLERPVELGAHRCRPGDAII